MGVDHQRLNLTDRKGYPGLLSQHLCDVDSRERCVIGKIKSLFVASLTVEQAGELMAVAESELNLKSRAVDIIYILSADGSVG